MFASALEELRPKQIHLIASPRAVHKSLTFPYLFDFFQKRVLTKVTSPIRERYLLANLGMVPGSETEMFYVRGVEYIRADHQDLIIGEKFPELTRSTTKNDVVLAERFRMNGIYPNLKVWQQDRGCIASW